MNELPEFLTLMDVARVANLSYTTIREAHQVGRLRPSAGLKSGQPLFLVSEVKRFLDARAPKGRVAEREED